MEALLIFVPGIFLAIWFAVSAVRGSKKHYMKAPQPTTPTKSSRDWCSIHNSYFGVMGTTCPSCENDFHNDVYAGVFPPGIDESNKDLYFVEDWIALRKIDMKWHSGEITEQEAIRQRDEYVKTVIFHRIAIARGTAPEVQKAKADANAKRLNNYAGAAQYSGITPK